MGQVTVVIGAGQIGQAIARRVSAGKHVVLADLHQANADAAAEALAGAGFDTDAATVDVSSRESVHALVQSTAARGDITGVIHAAGVSPSQAPPEAILAVDLYGTAVILEEFGNVIASGGAGVVIASQSGHRLGALSPEQDKALAMTPAEELLALPMLQPDQVADTLHAYQLAKRGNSLRVMAESVRWAKRGARLNAISPGIIITPLAKDELAGPRGEGYRRMIDSLQSGGLAPRTRSEALAPSSWARTERSSREAISSWTVASPRPTSSETSRPGNESRQHLARGEYGAQARRRLAAPVLTNDA